MKDHAHLASQLHNVNVFVVNVASPQQHTSAPGHPRNRIVHPVKAAQKRAAHYGTVREGAKIEALNQACREAQSNGWVLSPKEIVFHEQEFLTWLSKRVDVYRQTLCNHVSIPVAQAACFYPDDRFWRDMRNWILPWSMAMDRLLGSTGLIRRVAEDYVFMGYECAVK